MAGKTRDVLRGAGAVLLADSSAHYDSQIVTARFAGRPAPAIARELQARKVLVAARHGNLRVSPHFYNDEADVARLAEALYYPPRVEMCIRDRNRTTIKKTTRP